MKCLNFFKLEKAGRGILAFVSKKMFFSITTSFLLVVLALSSCKRTGVIFFEIQYQSPPVLTFNKLVTSSRNVTALDLLKQIPEREKKGFTVKEVIVKDPYKAFAQVTGAKSALSLNIKKIGTFTVKIVLEQNEYLDAVINDAEIELRIKRPAKALTFDTLTTTYKSSLGKAEILGQVQGEKLGYTLKSIAIGNSYKSFAEVKGSVPNFSLTLKKVGTFTAMIVLEHPNYEDAAITGAAFEITKGAAKNLTFDKLITDRRTVTRAEILGQVQGEKLGYTLKSITVSNTSFAQSAGAAPNISIMLKKVGTFTATIVLEHPFYEDVTITGAEFELIIKAAAKVLSFDRLRTVYKSSLNKAEILGQVQGEKAGYTLKSITVSNTSFAQSAGAAPNISIMLKKVGTFTAMIILEHPRYEDVTIHGAAFEITKESAKVLSFDRLRTAYKSSLNKAEILGQLQGEKLGYTLKSITVSDTSFAQAAGAAPNISIMLKKVGTFTAMIILEHPRYEDVTIPGAAFEITKESAKVLRFDRLRTAYKSSLNKAEILGQLQGEKLGYTLKSITVSNTSFAQAAGAAPNISITLRRVGTFTATIVLEHPRYGDVTITSAAFEITKESAKVLRFDRLRTAYKSSLSKAEILGQVQGEKLGYTLKSITVSDTSFAQAAGAAPNISITLRRVGTFTAMIILEHPRYEDVTIPGAAFEITKESAKVLSFDRLRTAYKSSLSKAEILGQVQGEKAGYTLKSITVSNTAFAQAAGTAPNISITLRRVGTFTATIVLEHPRYGDVTITSAAFEITKESAKVLSFDRLRTAYKSSLSKAEILGQVQGEKLGYTLKSITVSNTSFAQSAGAAPNISITLRRVGIFTATIVLEHPRYEDVTIHGAAFEITKAPAKSLTFNRLVTDRGTVTRTEILNQIRGEKTSYTLKRIFSITPTSAATVVGTAPNLSLMLATSSIPFTFTATIVLESPFYEDATIVGAAFKRGQNKFIFQSSSKTIISIDPRYRPYFNTTTTVTFPDQIIGVNVERIEGGSFYGMFNNGFVNRIETIHLPKDLKTIGARVFSNSTKLTAIGLPNSLREIGSFAFMNCRSLASISIPSGVTTIRHYAFARCHSLTSISIPDSVTLLEKGVFSRCTELTSVTLSNSLTVIDRLTFMQCTKLNSITIPDSVTTINGFAFARCTSLTAITIPDSVTTLDGAIFQGCTNLTVTLEQTDPSKISISSSDTAVGSGRFIKAFDDVKAIRVPAASLGAYQRTAAWIKWAGKMVGY